ncbi:DUF2085 domain-containing protein [Methanobacterium sp.]|uniref:DUF2085 domain-containing protein n=1 Tax=Methanobacterium sp. TaxID=2164 RepID=UPI002ABBA8C0|nr:DUF2085 domain-containing protein [Methanobacterium sp.]MDY9924322.1 DUF2085 domain-containing protein [Methanobacterium sp.]
MLGKISYNKHFEDIYYCVRIISRFFCHRIPERTFHVKGRYFPVCSRCTGLYIGAFLYLIYVYFNYVNYSRLLILIAILITIPTILDGLTQFIGSRESNNSLRFGTGLIGGIGFAILIKGFNG